MSHKFKYSRLVGALVTLATTTRAADVLTLEQAVSQALNQNRTVQTSVLNAEKAREDLAATRTRHFPSTSLYMLGAQQLRSFDFTLEKGVLGNYQSTSPVPDQDVHLKTPLEPTGMIIGKVSQPLSSLIRIHRNMDTLKTGIELANEHTREQRQKIARDVKRVYYSLQQVEASLRTVQETTRLYQEVESLLPTTCSRASAAFAEQQESAARLDLPSGRQFGCYRESRPRRH